MNVADDDRKSRLLLSRCMVEILRPCSEIDINLTLNERLVGYAIAFGVYGGQPLGINKLAEMVGLPRSTVRGVLDSLMGRGWVVRGADKTYDFSTEFHNCADEWFDLPTKYNAILKAADGLRPLRKRPAKPLG